MALRDINLVPTSVLETRYLLRHATAWAIAYGLVIGLLLASYLGYTRGVIAPRRQAASEELVRKRLAETIAQIEAKKEELERVAFVRDISRPFGVSEVMSALAAAMDPKTWLTETSLESLGFGEYRLLMTGLASSNSRLGATIKALGADPRFADITLRNSSEMLQSLPRDGERGPAIVQFTIEATVRMEDTP